MCQSTLTRNEDTVGLNIAVITVTLYISNYNDFLKFSCKREYTCNPQINTCFICTHHTTGFYSNVHYKHFDDSLCNADGPFVSRPLDK